MHCGICKHLGSHIALKYKYFLNLFSQRAWRWPNKGRNMSPWQYAIFIVYKIKCCVMDWHVVFIILCIYSSLYMSCVYVYWLLVLTVQIYHSARSADYLKKNELFPIFGRIRGNTRSLIFAGIRVSVTDSFVCMKILFAGKYSDNLG